MLRSVCDAATARGQAPGLAAWASGSCRSTRCQWGNIFLELNELRKPRAFEALAYTNATLRFTTPSPKRDSQRCPARDVSLATQTFKESRATTFGHHDADSSARLDPVKALASLDPIRGSRP
jgi:hypothetical protein